jgi:hypothetical protein
MSPTAEDAEDPPRGPTPGLGGPHLRGVIDNVKILRIFAFRMQADLFIVQPARDDASKEAGNKTELINV